MTEDQTITTQDYANAVVRGIIRGAIYATALHGMYVLGKKIERMKHQKETNS